MNRHKPGIHNYLYIRMNVSKSLPPSPHFSPVCLSSSDSCLLSIRYDNLLTMSSLQTALDAPSLVFLMRSVPGAPPTGTLRVSKSVPDGFVPSAGTCSLRPSPCLQPAEPAPAKAGGQALGATLRAAVAVQIVCPDNLSLNHSYGYAFGRRHPLAAQIRRNHRINW